VTIRVHALKQDTGHVGNGKMLLKEISDKIDELKDVNVVDDLQFFMNNDPLFYRKILYPAISDMKHKLKSGQGCQQDHFHGCIKKGIDSYCKKFKIRKNPKDIFSDAEIKELAEKMFHNEKERIEKGTYDRSDK